MYYNETFLSLTIMNEFAFEYNYNCKYCSTKSSLQNLHENFVESLWMNLLLNINTIVSIVQQNLPYKIYKKNFNIFFINEFAFKYEYNGKYCPYLPILFFFVPIWLHEKDSRKY